MYVQVQMVRRMTSKMLSKLKMAAMVSFDYEAVLAVAQNTLDRELNCGSTKKNQLIERRIGLLVAK